MNIKLWIVIGIAAALVLLWAYLEWTRMRLEKELKEDEDELAKHNSLKAMADSKGWKYQPIRIGLLVFINRTPEEGPNRLYIRNDGRYMGFDDFEKQVEYIDELHKKYNVKNKKQTITLTAHEIQSGSTRVKNAEGLIVQLPSTHDGRNTWLLNYGVGIESQEKRKKYPDVKWNDETQALETSPKEKK